MWWSPSDYRWKDAGDVKWTWLVIDFKTSNVTTNESEEYYWLTYGMVVKLLSCAHAGSNLLVVHCFTVDRVQRFQITRYLGNLLIYLLPHYVNQGYPVLLLVVIRLPWTEPLSKWMLLEKKVHWSEWTLLNPAHFASPAVTFPVIGWSCHMWIQL